MKNVTEKEVITAVGQAVGLKYDEIVSPKKRAVGDVLYGQIICFAILRLECPVKGVDFEKMKGNDIAFIFGKKNRSSVSRLTTLYKNLMETNKYFIEKVNRVVAGVENILVNGKN